MELAGVPVLGTRWGHPKQNLETSGGVLFSQMECFHDHNFSYARRKNLRTSLL